MLPHGTLEGVKIYEKGTNTTDISNAFKAFSTKIRNSRLEVFCRKGILGNFANFTGSTCASVSCFNTVAGLRPVLL